jgi:hypothetical protein
MPPERDPPRQYTDREVRLILKSAVELQQRTDGGEEPSGRMSLTQLEQVAAEAGVDPVYVRRAAAALDTVGAPSERNAFLGGPTFIVLEQVVDAALDPGQFDQLLDVTRAVSREVGEVSTVGRQFGWKGGLDGAKAEVSIFRNGVERYRAHAGTLIEALAARTLSIAAPDHARLESRGYGG